MPEEGSSSTVGAIKGTTPWVEKYRPASINDVVHQEQVCVTLNNAISTGNLPHLLFYGPPGTGKTSAVLALAKDLFGPEMYKSRVLELNASDERGIDVVRNKIKNFAALSVSGQRSSTHPCPPFKLIVLDEADCMTTDAQSALRRTMETYTKITRFCIICNYVSRIIGPIASRCAKFRFQPLSQNVMADRLTHIATSEGYTLTEPVRDNLMSASGGDLRKAITLMQNSFLLHGNAVTPQAITDAAAVLPKEVIDNFIQACKSNSFEKAQEKVTNLMADGYPANQIVFQLMEWVVSKEAAGMSSNSKAILCRQLAITDKCLVDGADETLQMLHLASVTMQALQAAS